MNKNEIKLALEALDFNKKITAPRKRALKKCVEEILLKISDMDAEIIDARRDDIYYLRQCRAFLGPLIRKHLTNAK